MGEAGLQSNAHRSRMRHITMYNRLKQESTWSFAASDADVATGYRGAVLRHRPQLRCGVVRSRLAHARPLCRSRDDWYRRYPVTRKLSSELSATRAHLVTAT